MKKLFLLFVLLLNFCLFGQIPDSSNFFPIAVGNEYQFNHGNNYWFGTIEEDTIYPNGKHYISLPFNLFEFGDTRVDSNGNILSAFKPFFPDGEPDEYILYKADAELYEVWPVAWDFNVVIDTGYARIIYDDTLLFFGEPRRVRGVLIFDESYYYYFYWLAKGIGIIRSQYDDGTTIDLSYAKINGIEYGKLVSVEDEYNKPLNFKVSQNYPNPFNPSTQISYSIKTDGFVNLSVYNSLGEKVETLVNESQSVGNYTVSFNADNLPSGVYFYTIRGGNPSSGSGQSFIETKKMILLR